MPWKCPACQTQIRHGEHEERPRADTLYRCHICRLELMLDTSTDRLTVASMRSDEPNQRLRRTS